MRLPGDATLIIVRTASTSQDEGARDRQARVAALATAWREASLPIIHLQHLPAPSAAPDNLVEPRLVVTGEDVFLSTGLENLLTERGATTIVLCGCLGASDAAVHQACQLGFRTFVVVDAADRASEGQRRPDCVAIKDKRDSAVSVSTVTALAAAAQAGAWRRERVNR